MTINFFAATELVIIGRDAERADLDNPRGEIIGHAAFVFAEDPRTGERRQWLVKTGLFEGDVLPAAKVQAAALNARMATGRLPIRFEQWEPSRPAYGSRAWLQWGEAEELELERSEASR